MKDNNLTWDDIIESIQKGIANSHGETDEEKLQYFKEKILGHLDKLSNEPVDYGKITRISQWADIIAMKVADFREEKGVYPNILLANTSTYDKIDKYYKKHPENLIYDGCEESPEFDGLSGFYTSEYNLDFCIDNDITINHFRLVFDENPDFDGETIIEYKFESTAKKVKFSYKKAA
ncbi:hypothetical protein R84B8_02080 [Treponema sp. R8-4-B8]